MIDDLITALQSLERVLASGYGTGVRRIEVSPEAWQRIAAAAGPALLFRDSRQPALPSNEIEIAGVRFVRGSDAEAP